MKKLNNTEAEIKKSVTYKKACMSFNTYEKAPNVLLLIVLITQFRASVNNYIQVLRYTI